MDWFSKVQTESFPNHSVSEFWTKVTDIIDPFNPTVHYGLINEHLEQNTYLNGNSITLDDLYLVAKLMKCKSWSKMLTSKTRPFHICRWFMQVFSLFPDSSFEFYQRRIERIDGRLIKAIEEGNLTLFEILLELVDVNARSPNPDEDGACPIHIAALKANKLALEKLLNKGASIETTDKEGLTPIFYAVQSKNLEIFLYLIEKGANLFHVEKQGRTLFYWAASLGRIEMLDLLIEAGLDPNATTKLGRTALSKSGWNGSVEITKYLLSIPTINIDIKDTRGRTALHNAVWGSAGGREGRKMGQNSKDSPECARLLLAKGCDIEAQDNGGNTPLCIACSTYSPESLKLLLEHGANMLYLNYKGQNPYHQALGRGNVELAKYLVDRGMPINIPSERLSCVQICVKFNELNSLKWLLENKVPITEADFIFALEKSNRRIFQLILEFYSTTQDFFQLAMKHGNQEIKIFAAENAEISGEGVEEGLKHDKIVAELVLRKWNGKITHLMLEKMIELKIDSSPYLCRAEPTGNILRMAIKQKNLELACKLIDDYPELAFDADSYSGNTALHIACISEMNEIIPKLVGIAKDPAEYILRKNVKEMTAITLSQIHDHRLSIAELLKELVRQSKGNTVFSQIKGLEYTLNPVGLTPHQYKDSMPIGYWPNPIQLNLKEETPYTWIDTTEGLDLMLEKLKGFSIIGVDLEYHLYKAKIGCLCLVQISNGLEDFIIDALVNRNYLASVLAQLIDNPEIVKIFHGADSDLLWLQNDFDLHPVRIFDTARAYRILKGENMLPSLVSLLWMYFGIEIDKTFKISEWRIRPLPGPMMEYARNDARYLIELYKRLMDEMTVEQINHLIVSCNSLCLKSPDKKFSRITLN